MEGRWISPEGLRELYDRGKLMLRFRGSPTTSSDCQYKLEHSGDNVVFIYHNHHVAGKNTLLICDRMARLVTYDWESGGVQSLGGGAGAQVALEALRQAMVLDDLANV